MPGCESRPTPSRGFGRGISRSSSFSGPPGSSITNARIISIFRPRSLSWLPIWYQNLGFATVLGHECRACHTRLEELCREELLHCLFVGEVYRKDSIDLVVGLALENLGEMGTALARVASHNPNKGQVLHRYDGWYASRTRGIRRRAGTEEEPVYAAPVRVPTPTAAVPLTTADHD